MELVIASLVVEAISLAVSVFGEIDRRASKKRKVRLATRLLALDSRAIAREISSVRLASAMRGALTAATVGTLFEDQTTRTLLSEYVVGLVAGADDADLQAIRAAASQRATSVLAGQVDARDAELFATEVIEAVGEACSRAIREALDADPELSIATLQLSSLRRVVSLLGNIDRQIAALARRDNKADREERERFLLHYRQQCVQVHGVIQPPDFDTNRKIPIADLYVAPQLSKGEGQGSGIPLGEFVSAIDRSVVLGDPGGGKSTLSHYIASSLAADASAPLPIFVTLRLYAKRSDEISILSYIEQSIAPLYQVEPVDGVIEDALLAGDVVVIFDGLDELVDTSRRREISASVEAFCSMYPLARVLVTSRRIGYDQARLDPQSFDVTFIGQFDDSSVGEYVRKWFLSQPEYADESAVELATSFMEQSQAVRDLRSNPLMLALMCIIFQGENFIPRRRPDIYERCAKLLFEKWDGHRGIEVPLQARDHVDSAMQHLAFYFLESGAGDSGVSLSDLVNLMTAYLYPRAFDTARLARSAAEEFIEFCSGRAWVFTDAGTLADGEKLYMFTHRTFMEYFAALHLVSISESPERLARRLLPRIANQEWDVVAQLAVQKANGTDRGTERALTVMLTEPRRRKFVNRTHVLEFIARCTQFAVISPQFVRDLTTACLLHFANGEAREGSVWSDGSHSPLQNLTEMLRPEHEEISSEALLAAIRSLERDQALFDRVLLYAIERLELRWTNLMIYGSDFSRDFWVDSLREAARLGESRLRQATVREPQAWVLVAAAGLCTLEEAVDEMKIAGLSFGEIYFLPHSTLFGLQFFEESLTSRIIGALARAEDGVELQPRELLQRLAALFLRDFDSMAPRSRVPEMRMVGYQRLSTSLSFSEAPPGVEPVVQEAVALALVGSAEWIAEAERARTEHLGLVRKWIQMARRSQPAASMPGPEEELIVDFEKWSISDDTKAFLRSWLIDQTSVFESSSSPLRTEEESI